MRKLCKQYISNTKKLFPLIGKPERRYLANLATTIHDYCEEENVTSLNDLYEKFGNPQDVINAYYSTKDINYMLKRISISHLIKRSIIVLLITALIVTGLYCYLLYDAHQVFKQDAIFSEESIIE